MRLHDLLDATDVLESFHDAPVDVSDVTHDSRSARPGSLFCCMTGVSADGHDFAAAAVASGAVALLVEREVAPVVPQMRVESVRRAIGPVAARIHGDPSHDLPVVGITGTNGKTTTTYLVESIANAAGMHPAVLGTTGIRVEGRAEVPPRTGFTTPEAPDLQRTLAELRDRGVGMVAMEVSSHALSERRVDGTRFAVVCFTNLTHDHLDYHGTLASYATSKARLFAPEFSDRAAINIDDPRGRDLALAAADAGLDVVTFSTESSAMVRATDLQGDARGSTFRMKVRDDAIDVRLPLPGRFNVENAVAAAATMSALGIELPTIALGLSRAFPVPGRFEPIGPGTPFAVIVDYAHTPEGIAAVLRAARELGRGKVSVVFGCGGDRDQAKRPSMGAAAGSGADFVTLTNDNPRSEDPDAIAAAAAVGLRAVDAEFVVELDRRLAIRSALQRAELGDTVLILGKGAETQQQIGAEQLPFDDRVVASEELDALAWS